MYKIMNALRVLGYRSLHPACGFAWSMGHRNLVAFASIVLTFCGTGMLIQDACQSQKETESLGQVVFVHSGIKDETESSEVAAISRLT